MPQFRALSNITHGEALNADENPVKTHGGDQASVAMYDFPYGSIVTGLDEDTMKALWAAGVLEQVQETAAPQASVSVKATPTEPAAPASEPGPTGEGGATATA